MADENPLLTVVVRTGGAHPTLLARALASVAAQSYRPLEVVLVTDAGAALDVAALRAALADVSLAAVLEAERARDALSGRRVVAWLADYEELRPGQVAASARGPDPVDVGALHRRLAAASATEDELRRRAVEFRERALRAEATLRAIEHSRAWRLAEWLRTRVRDRVLPPGSRRRAAYSRVLGARPAAPRAAPASVVELPIAPAALVAAAASSPAPAVSVVIPTLNGGADLEALLASLRTQRGLGRLEVIAVDSGSTDGTVAACERADATVVPYRGGAFNHGAARDQGARAASGEFVLFVSQDALPEGDDAIARLVRALDVHPRTAASTARQVARPDADVFSRWQIACFDERVLDYPGDTAVALRDGATLAELEPAARRRAAQLNDVMCCVRRSVLGEVPFQEVPYAEDLDLGLRLLAASYRLAFLPSVRVVHSHDRSPAYDLRRAYVDWRYLVPVLGFPTRDWAADGVAAPGDLAAGLVALARRLAAVLAGPPLGGGPGLDSALLLAAVDRAGASSPAADPTGVADLLEAAAAALPPAGGGPRGERARSLAREQLGRVLAELGAFAERSGNLPASAAEASSAVSRAYASVAGWCLADFASWHARATGSATVRDALDTLLGGGV